MTYWGLTKLNVLLLAVEPFIEGGANVDNKNRMNKASGVFIHTATSKEIQYILPKNETKDVSELYWSILENGSEFCA